MRKSVQPSICHDRLSSEMIVSDMVVLQAERNRALLAGRDIPGNVDPNDSASIYKTDTTDRNGIYTNSLLKTKEPPGISILATR